MGRASLQDNRGRAWAIFAVGNLGFILSMFYRVSPSVIAPQLARDLDMGAAGLSDLTAAFFYAFAALQIPLGLILDRLGPRIPMTVLSLMGAAGAAWFATAGGAGEATWARALMGVGMSCGLMGPLALYAAWFPPVRFATISGMHVATGALGQILAATPLALLSESLGWRGAFWLFAGINLLQAAAVLVVVRNRPPGQTPPPRRAENPLKGLGAVLRMPAYWGISMGTFFRFGCFMSLQGLWAGPFIIYGLGRDAVTAGNALLVMSLAYMVSLPLAGRLSDHWLASRKRVIAPTMFVFSAMLLALAYMIPGVSALWLYLAFGMIGLSNGPGQIMYAHIKELGPAGYTATAMTGINLFTMLGPAAVMQITGIMVAGEAQGMTGAGSFRPVWLVMAAMVLAAGLVYMRLPDSRVGGQQEDGA